MGIYRWLQRKPLNTFIHLFQHLLMWIQVKIWEVKNKKLHSNRLLLIGEGVQGGFGMFGAHSSIFAEDAEVQGKFFEL